MSISNKFPGSADDAGLDAQALRATDPRQCQILNRKSKVQNEKNSSKTINYLLYIWIVPMQNNRRFLFLNGGVCIYRSRSHPPTAYAGCILFY